MDILFIYKWLWWKLYHRICWHGHCIIGKFIVQTSHWVACPILTIIEVCELFRCLIKVEVKPYKMDEFVTSMHAFASTIRRQKGCLGFNVCQDSEKERAYSLVGEWKTRKALKKYFQTKEYEALIGATRVLCETFEMTLTEVSQTGGIELAREQIVSQWCKDEYFS